jgi:two-component system cell cycle sensor histidine kinase/response regulator CckA
MVLPAVPGSAAAGWVTRQPDRGARQHAGSVLVVDDEAAILEVVHRVLTSAGYWVTTAGDGQEALRLLRDPAMLADLVLTDVVMPGMSGEAFAAKAQRIRPGIRVLFMSGYDRPDTDSAGWPQAGSQVVTKPFSRSSLLARIAQALAADTGPADTGPADTGPAGIRAGNTEPAGQPARAEHR